ncbi:substrate-binding domain-containing protein [Ammoniphilus sp. YIM 78166]|uniref:substrate-binding domain-containing protein n=1 Tax=Ammoniphilus sp. YIM 78166 TaxID=1644106 RepID=UPI001430AE70|nr:substrate-binding domain-containing protein [Ammoniphilus sp. YIM 78166]
MATQTANWSRAEALALAENWLQTFQLDAIVAHNDEMALGALKAVESHGKLGQIRVIGIDAIPDALDAVKNGKLDGSLGLFVAWQQNMKKSISY